MAEKKDQHYVPKQYLRNFSWDNGKGERKQINLFNIKNKRIIRGVSLSNQCAETYFYGKNPVIENGFGLIEGVASDILHSIVNKNFSPTFLTKEHERILSYILFLHARTKYVAEEMQELRETLLKSRLVENTFAQEDIAGFRQQKNNPIFLPLKITAQGIPLARDLACKVLVNNTETNFITSDNPVVFYNLAYEKSLANHIGLASKGLLIITPISPRYILLFYDKNLYKCGERKRNYANVIEKNDVFQLNDLQWLNARENIYFDNTTSTSEILRGSRRNISRRSSKRINITENEIQGTSKTHTYICRNKKNISIKMQCIKKKANISDDESKSNMRLFRNLALAKSHETFLEQLSNRELYTNEWFNFIDEEHSIYNFEALITMNPEVAAK